MKYASYILLCVVAGFWSGCEQVIEIDMPEHEPRLVVNGVFMPDSTFEVLVSNSRAIQATQDISDVQDARVLVYEGGQLLDSLVHVNDGLYRSTVTAQPLGAYEIEVSAPGYATVRGADAIPALPVVSNIQVVDSAFINDTYGYAADEISFELQDAAGDRNFYVLSVFLIDTFATPTDTFIDRQSAFVTLDDVVLDPTYTDEGLLISDLTFDGENRRISLQVDSWYRDSGSSIYLSVSAVSRHYFDYMRTLRAALNAGGNPFAEPVLVHSNMTSDMGIFAGADKIWMLLP